MKGKYLLVFLLLVISCAVPIFANVSVKGEGVINVTPTKAVINFEIYTLADTLNEAISDNTKEFEKIKNELSDLGISDDDLKQVSVYSSLEHSYDYESSSMEKKVVGYSFTQNLELTTNDLFIVDKIYEVLLNPSVRMIAQINYTVDNKEKLYYDALVLAIKNGEEKAKLIGNSFSLKDIEIMNIVEENNYGSIQTEYEILVNDSGVEISVPKVSVNSVVNLVFNTAN